MQMMLESLQSKVSTLQEQFSALNEELAIGSDARCILHGQMGELEYFARVLSRKVEETQLLLAQLDLEVKLAKTSVDTVKY